MLVKKFAYSELYDRFDQRNDSSHKITFCRKHPNLNALLHSYLKLIEGNY